MEDLRNNNFMGEPEQAAEPEVKKSLYKVEVSFETSEDVRTEKIYHFKKPNVSSYDRYVKSMSKGPTKANRAFVMDNVVDEQRSQLAADLEQYPAIAITISDKLLSMLGLGDATLTKL